MNMFAGGRNENGVCCHLVSAETAAQEVQYSLCTVILIIHGTNAGRSFFIVYSIVIFTISPFIFRL